MYQTCCFIKDKGVYDDSSNDFLRSAQIIIEDVNRLIKSPIVVGEMIKARAL